MNQSHFHKAPFSGLHPLCVSWYSFVAVAKSTAGIGVPCNSMATTDALCVFFYVVAQTHPFSGLWCLCAHRGSCQIMVVRAGQPSGWPVFIEAGYANPVRAATSEIGVSGGGYQDHESEAAAMLATTPTQNPQFIWLIAAVRRDMPTITAKIHHIAAETEQEARRTLVRDHVCFFAGRIRTGGAYA